MGGLMTLYATSRYNHIFSRGAALSPSVGFAPDKVKRMIITSNYGDDTVLYMDYGQKEFAYHPHAKTAYNRTANALVEKGVLLNSRIVPDGEHTEASWEKQIPVFMQSLFFGL